MYKTVVILTLSSVLPVLASEFNQLDSCPLDNKMDYIKLSVQWQPGYCQRSGCRSEQKFSIHGLWPGKDDDSYSPSDCCSNDVFEISKLTDLLPRLQVSWPSLMGSNGGFWRHEYDKHGACTRNLAGFGSVESYFERTLSLFEKLELNDLIDVKSEKQIGKYELIDTLTKNHNHRKIELDCEFGFIKEVRFCFSHEVPNEPIDCPGARDDCFNQINL